jgi:hypothetical protein
MSWTKIQGDELQRLQTRLEMPPQSSILEAFTLRTPFYHNGELVKMNDGMGTMFMVAAGPGELSAREFYPLTGTSDEIRAANKAAKLVINTPLSRYYGATATRSEPGPHLNSVHDQQPRSFRPSPEARRDQRPHSRPRKTDCAPAGESRKFGRHDQVVFAWYKSRCHPAQTRLSPDKVLCSQ